MAKIYEHHFQVPFYATDIKGDIKLSQLINQCLLVTGLQSEVLGLTDQALYATYGLVWVVTDYQMDIRRLPHFAEEVTIKTQATSYNKLFCYRDFVISDQEGQVLVEILASFVLMDAQTRKVVPVIAEVVEVFGGQKTKKIYRSFKPDLAKADTPEPIQVTSTDFDQNGHVNNSRYIDWLFTGLELDFLRQHFPKRLSISYKKEVKELAPLQLLASHEGLTSQLAVTSSLGTHVQAVIDWEVVDNGRAE